MSTGVETIAMGRWTAVAAAWRTGTADIAQGAATRVVLATVSVAAMTGRNPNNSATMTGMAGTAWVVVMGSVLVSAGKAAVMTGQST